MCFEISKKNVHLIGNIGRPVLSKLTLNLILFCNRGFLISTWYSKFFKTDIGAILNLRTDHLERHGNLKIMQRVD